MSPGVGTPGPPPASPGDPLRGDLDSDLARRVIAVLERDVNPSIAAHGGHAELVGIEGTTAFLRLGGGCQGCGMATVTLSQGIEVAITEAVPEIDAIVDVTDHASGSNPYFEPAKK
jgi:Fe/S biogenesis protein NfuA